MGGCTVATRESLQGTEMQASIELRNDLDEVVPLIEFVREFGNLHGLSPSVVFDLTLALEEVFTNVVRHGYVGKEPHTIGIGLGIEVHEVTAEVEDDGQPFNPLLMPEMDISAPLDARRGGGMGIHLVRKLMDEVQYDGAGGRNRLRLRKRVDGPPKGT